MNPGEIRRPEQIVVASQFQGPPNSGNGGYACGVLAARLGEKVLTCVLKAPIAIDQPLSIITQGQGLALVAANGHTVIMASPDPDAELPKVPAAVKFDQAKRAGSRFVGLARRFHPVCFTCASDLEEGFGLRVFVGRCDDVHDDIVAGVWTPHPNFGDSDGLTTHEAVWGALDCPGSVAWVEKGGGGGLLGTMTCEVLRRPAVGEGCIVMAWPIERSGRKSVAGTALYSREGVLLARSRQVWIGPPPAES